MKYFILLQIILLPAFLYGQTPSDPYYQYQFYLDMLNVQDAWDITKGDPSIIVSVLDNGFTTHEDLPSSKIVHPLGATWADNSAHGIATAGIIAADHNTIGIAGVSPQVKIMPVRILNAKGSLRDESDVIDAYEHARTNGAQIFNQSIQLYDESIPNGLKAMIEDPFGNYTNIVFVAATGNKSADSLAFPASSGISFAVGSLDENLMRYNYSNYGSGIDIMAPSGPAGVRTAGPCGLQRNSSSAMNGTIWTLDIPGSQGYNPGNFKVTTPDCYNEYTWSTHPGQETPDVNYTSHFAGTSASTPMVVGVSALMLSVNPNLNRGQVYSILNNTAVKVPAMADTNYTLKYGYGMLNAYAAVKEALPEQYDNTIFSTSTTLSSAHIDGNTTLGSGVTLTIPADEVVVIEGSMLGAATNTHLKVHGKMIVDYDATISRVHIEVKDGGEVLVKPGATFELSTGA